MTSPIGSSFLDHFAALRDPRQSWKVVYPLAEVLLVVLSGTIAGAEDFVEIRRWAVLHTDFLRRFLPFKNGIPSHDTLNNIMNAIDAELFGACFTQWVASLVRDESAPGTGPEVVAIDGKTSRRTHDRAQDRNPLHLVSAWASSQRLVLGQQACEAKSNEITAIPLLLDRLAIRGALVTIDAMGCQTRIAQKIIDGQADYLLAVKDNWPNLHAEIARAFDDPNTTGLMVHETTVGDHGRIEKRRHVVSHDVAFLNTDRRFPGEPRFPGLKAIAMVETEVERNGKISRERRFSISSLTLDAGLFARAVREHWHVENRLHWVLDVVFHEEAVQPARAGADTLLAQAFTQLAQIGLRLRLARLQDHLRVGLDIAGALVSAHRLGRDHALGPEAGLPADRRRDPDTRTLGRLAAGRARLDSGQNTLA